MSHIETQKNIKAGTYTGIICGIMLLLFFIVSWTIPQDIPPQTEEGIEVNLGNSDQGSGDIPPQIPGPPAAAEEEINRPPKTQIAKVEEAKDVETNDNDKEAPDVKVPKVDKPKPNNPNIPKKEITEPVKKQTNKPVEVVNPKPAPPKPKYVYKGGDGSGAGGNNADTWNNSRDQGIAGGRGDQGKPNGNPNSDSYTGNGGSGRSGVYVSKGLQGRKITRLPSFEDEFNENAKVAVDIKIDKSGAVISASYQPRGSTTSDGAMRDIALRKARQLKFSSTADGAEEQIGTIIFNFRLKS